MRGVNRQPRKVIRVSQIDLIESDSDDEDVSFFFRFSIFNANTQNYTTLSNYNRDRRRINFEGFCIILTYARQRAKKVSFSRIDISERFCGESLCGNLLTRN